MWIDNGENKCSKTKRIQETKKISGSEILGKGGKKAKSQLRHLIWKGSDEHVTRERS